MFLQKYVHELDEQLARLITARDTIAALVGPKAQPADISRTATAPVAAEAEPAATEQPHRLAALEPESLATLEVPVTPAKRRGRPKGSKNKTTMMRTRPQAAPEPRALSSAIPSGPVAVSPAQLAKHREPAPVHEPETAAATPDVPGGGLDALIRELTERRVSSFSPAA